MTQKPQKSQVNKKGENIEVSLGDGVPSKYQIMVSIAKHHTVYGATVWLNTPVPEYENKTPAALMLEGELKIVASLVEDFENERKNK